MLLIIGFFFSSLIMWSMLKKKLQKTGNNASQQNSCKSILQKNYYKSSVFTKQTLEPDI